nr:MGMT family protein [uncultured Holophaga sp.]
MDFRERVMAVVAAIPVGRVATYGQVALMAGFPRRARQVGGVLRGLPAGTEIPWQRVIKAPGQVAFWGGGFGASMQMERLRAEGVEVSESGAVDLARFRWSAEVTS